MPVSHIFVCEHCKESFSESAKCYLRKKKDVTKGNQQKMRETLLVVRDALDTISAHEDDIEFVRAWIRQTKEAVQAALAAPPRNCDVGTAEEQIARFNEFCDSEWQNSGSANCGNCPLWVSGRIGHDCQIRWEQMPYTAEEGGAE